MKTEELISMHVGLIAVLFIASRTISWDILVLVFMLASLAIKLTHEVIKAIKESKNAASNTGP